MLKHPSESEQEKELARLIASAGEDARMKRKITLQLHAEKIKEIVQMAKARSNKTTDL